MHVLSRRQEIEYKPKSLQEQAKSVKAFLPENLMIVKRRLTIDDKRCSSDRKSFLASRKTQNEAFQLHVTICKIFKH